MTDQEVIQFLGTAGQRVCGRFAPEQLDREFELAGRRRNRNWWQWIVAGLLVTAEARGQGRTMGKPLRVERRHEKVMGDTVRVQVLDTVRVVGYGVEKKQDVVGAVTQVPNMELMVGEELYGIAGGVVACVRVRTGWKMVADTLAAVGLAPKRELEVYPNPARRGTVVSLRWQRTEPGAYEVGLFSSTGELVQQRKIEVGGKEQVDLLGLPPALPAGMYFLRAARPDGAKVITLRIMLM